MQNNQIYLLYLISDALFENSIHDDLSFDFDSVAKESLYQSVFPLFFNRYMKAPPKNTDAKTYSRYKNLFFTHLTSNTGNFAEHLEVHTLMKKHGIPYTSIKGVASARYYKNPSLRSMGDVDFLIKKEDLKKADTAVKSAGFTIDHGDDEDSKHIAYTRPPYSIWEMHKSVNGIPTNEKGMLINKEMESIIDEAQEISIEDITCNVPSDFHHGLIMLLHTLSHMTSEGIGLRHLCDWAVFVSSLDDNKFTDLFEEKLKSFGLWKYCCVLTLTCSEYLKMRECSWAEKERSRMNITQKYLETFIDDILNSGNFGFKDLNRYREIKYISDSKNYDIQDDGIIRQGIRSISSKVYSNHEFINRHRILLPAGWAIESAKYAYLLLSGKRKNKAKNDKNAAKH